MQAIRILLVDDSSEFRISLERLLSRLGFGIVGSVDSGVTALEVLAVCSDAIDVVILDLAMPGINGLETARRIRAGYPEIKIVILSLHATQDYRDAAAQVGVDAYVSKETLVPELHLALRGLRA